MTAGEQRPESSGRPVEPTVHAHGVHGRLDSVLEVVRFTVRPSPLFAMLDELPERMAKVFHVDVCSIYLLEGDDLVMRGNVGFPEGALGEVRLRIGEGVTGLAVECMRPISLAQASAHERHRSFALLGEDLFPVFLAVPVAGTRGPAGALVLQKRRGPPFSSADIELAVALTAPISALVERAKLIEALRGQGRSVTRGTRRVTLSGRAVIRGRAIGHVCAMRRPAGSGSRPDAGVEDREQVAKALDNAASQLRRAVDAYEARAEQLGLDTALFSDLRLILDDARVPQLALDRWAEDGDLVRALCAVGGEAARAAARSGDAYTVERAEAINEVCEAMAALAGSDPQQLLPRNAVLLGDQATLFDLLVTARADPVALLLGNRQQNARSVLVQQLLGVPTLVDVAGLLRWLTDGDLVLVDGDHGIVRVNPSRAEVGLFRDQQRSDLSSDTAHAQP